jgi:Restriction endonuclease
MSNSGTELELLVHEIEQHLLPQECQVQLNKREFDKEGEQVAEFDIVITGRLGSSVIKWLVECRDRPSEGPAPGSWIEQLSARRRRFNFDKVIAVSTTGFSKNAQAFAESEGLNLRTVKTFRDIVTDLNVKEANFYAHEVTLGPVDLSATHPEITDTKSLTSGELKLVNESKYVPFQNFVVDHARLDLAELAGSACFRFEFYCDIVDAIINKEKRTLKALALPIQVDVHVYEAKLLTVNLYSEADEMIGRDATFCFELPTGRLNLRILFLNNFDGTQAVRFCPPENVPEGFTVDSLHVFASELLRN